MMTHRHDTISNPHRSGQRQHAVNVRVLRARFQFADKTRGNVQDCFIMALDGKAGVNCRDRVEQWGAVARN